MSVNIKSWLLTAFITATCSFAITLFFTPHILIAGLNFRAYLNDNQGVLQVRPQAQAGKDNIVRMSPDLLYSACTFDLSNGPLHVTAPQTGQYMSVSFFADNSNNFFAINDRQINGDFDLVLAKPDMDFIAPNGSQVVEAPSEYGLVIIRYYLGKMAINEIDSFRQQAKCETL